MSAEHAPKQKGKKIEKLRKATGELVRMLGIAAILAVAYAANPVVTVVGGGTVIGSTMLEGKNKKSSAGHH